MPGNEAIVVSESIAPNSYNFGQAGDGPLRNPFSPGAQLRRYVRPGAALCSQIGNPIDIRHDFRPIQTLALGAGIS